MMKFQELYEENGESLTGWDKGFADDIVGKFVEYGAEMFLSPNQWKQVNISAPYSTNFPTMSYGAEMFLSPNQWKQVNRILERMGRSEEHTSELQSQSNLVCRLLLSKKKNNRKQITMIQSALQFFLIFVFASYR